MRKETLPKGFNPNYEVMLNSLIHAINYDVSQLNKEYIDANPYAGIFVNNDGSMSINKHVSERREKAKENINMLEKRVSKLYRDLSEFNKDREAYALKVWNESKKE